jgi:hypothetical protein
MANRAQVVAARHERDEARAKLAPVPAEVARRRARIVTLLPVGVAVMTAVVTGLLVRLLHVHSGRVVLGVPPALVAAHGSLFMCGRPLPRVHGQDPSHVTFKTVSGRRTLDLAGLVRVRRLLIPGKTQQQTYDGLILTDRHGVRVAVRDEDIITQVTARVARRRAGGSPERPLILVSDSAATRMGLEHGPWVVRAVLGLLWFVGVVGVVGVMLTAIVGPIFIGLHVAGIN